MDVAARTGKEARAWAMEQVNNPTQGWYRLCLSFVRQSFGQPGGVPDAGTSWDRSPHKHHTDNPEAIPADVPVYWELPSVADHVAYSLGDGWCLSNDILRSGKIDPVRIDTITRAWGGQLQGWSESINGGLVWEPKQDDPETPNVTAFLKADNLEDRLKYLRRIERHGEPKMRNLAGRLITSYERRQRTNDLIGDLRKELRRLEVKD